MTNCHADAYLGCEWRGGTDWTFDDPHALSTTATWSGDDVWSTNGFSLVTSFRGWYTLTNFIPITVGTQVEPDTTFSISCQEIFFLNDADFLSGGNCSSNRPERIRPVALKLTAPSGTAGNVTLVANGTAEPIVMTVSELGVTNRLEATNSIPLNITDPFARTGSTSVLVSCPKLGRGTLTATWTSTNGETRTATADFRCIEPLRKLVTIETASDGRLVNPSRLVYGTNTVLKVGVGSGLGLEETISADELRWSIVSGDAILSTNGWQAIVTPTTASGEVVVEVRFNDDEIQPRFVLPIVNRRVIPIRAFVVEPSTDTIVDTWSDEEILRSIKVANTIFYQVGIQFELQDDIVHGVSNEFWSVRRCVGTMNSLGTVNRSLHPVTRRLLDYYQCSSQYTSNDCVEVYFVGEFINDDSAAFHTPFGIVISRACGENTLAHELGHALGLSDCYPVFKRYVVGKLFYWAILSGAVKPVDRNFFCGGTRDWGSESAHGFYSSYDYRKSIMSNLLMYGYDSISAKDIPDGRVLSIHGYGDAPGETIWSPVGAESIKKTNQEVYTK